MAPNNRPIPLQSLCVPALSLTTFFVAALFAANPAHAQSNTSLTIGDACQLSQTTQACAVLAKSGPKPDPLFAALDISTTKNTAGLSHGQTSQASAEQTALTNCQATGATDCQSSRAVKNGCVGLAMSVTSRGTGMGTGDGPDRASAAAQAMTECQNVSGTGCVVRATACSSDNPAYPAALPLPSGGQAGSVDPNWVGAWEIDINGPNGGRWVMQVSSNGTYEMHSEALDQVGSNAGTFSAKAGRYTLHANNISWDDSGTYTFQPPGTIVAAGKLGTGTWHKIAQDDE
jgi:hypothetical protein